MQILTVYRLTILPAKNELEQVRRCHRQAVSGWSCFLTNVAFSISSVTKLNHACFSQKASEFLNFSALSLLATRTDSPKTTNLVYSTEVEV